MGDGDDKNQRGKWQAFHDEGCARALSSFARVLRAGGQAGTEKVNPDFAYCVSCLIHLDTITE